MYIQNNAKDKNGNPTDVILRSHEGFVFTLPPNVSWIWDSAGQELLKIHKVESLGGKDRHGFDNGRGVPAIMESTKKKWEEGSKQLTKVERYQVNHKYIPRAKLIETAMHRGVDKERLLEYQLDQSIDISVIVEEMNALPIPEGVKYPSNFEDDEEEPEENKEPIRSGTATVGAK